MNSKDDNLMPLHINHWLAASVEICFKKWKLNDNPVNYDLENQNTLFDLHFTWWQKYITEISR